MRMYDLISKKKYGGVHTKEEIDFIVEKFTAGEIPDYQMSAWLMCVYFNGMNAEETLNLTMAMANSGDMMDLSAIEGIKVDKHSTGGVGDKTTLVVAPILACLGVPVAKMSGRGLGHTGGTIDKLESIEGFNVSISNEEFINNVNTNKISLVAQTGNLAPADKKIYALRDVTAAVDSMPLIASSIMSKKLASGANAIVLDVKCGSGAFMQDMPSAVALAETMTRIGNDAGRRTVALITDMNEPLGKNVGNSLEVIEAIEVLKLKNVSEALMRKDGFSRLVEVCLKLAEYMYRVSGLCENEETAIKEVIRVIESGEALDKLALFAKTQGGNPDYIYDIDNFAKAKYEIPVVVGKSGYLSECNCSEVGNCCQMIGGGRLTKEGSIDLAVGIILEKKLGDEVKPSDVLAKIYANDEAKGTEAAARLLDAYSISEDKPKKNLIVKSIIE